jgi:hypothetical protein
MGEVKRRELFLVSGDGGCRFPYIMVVGESLQCLIYKRVTWYNVDTERGSMIERCVCTIDG